MAEVTLFRRSNIGASFSPTITPENAGGNEGVLEQESLTDFERALIKRPDLEAIYKRYYLPIWNFDATISESHTHTAEVTTHPVERGVDIADHIQIKPFNLTLDGIVTNTPLTPGVQGSATRILELYDDLVSLFESKQLLDVVTGLKRYTNMVITSVKVPREAPNRQHIIPSVELVQINTVEQAFVALESLGIPKRAKTKEEKDAEKTAASEQQERNWNPFTESGAFAWAKGKKLNLGENIAAGNPFKALFYPGTPSGYDPSNPFVTSPSLF